MTKLLNRKKIDIVGVVENYVDLEKKGNDERPYFVGLCPFHSEKSPSFIVFPNIQRFLCYGCFPEGGDVITFLSMYHHISYDEAKARGTMEVPPEDLALKQMKLETRAIDERLVASRCYALTKILPIGTCLEVFKLVDRYIETQQYTLLDRLLKRYKV